MEKTRNLPFHFPKDYDRMKWDQTFPKGIVPIPDHGQGDGT